MDFLTPTEAAALVGVNPSTFYRALAKHRATLLQRVPQCVQKKQITLEGLVQLATLAEWNPPAMRHATHDATQTQCAKGATQAQCVTQKDPLLEELRARVRFQEQLLQQQQETISSLLEERRRADHLLAATIQKIQALPAPPPQPMPQKSKPATATTKPATVEPQPHPAHSWPTWKKAAVILFAPHLLRGSGIRAA